MHICTRRNCIYISADDIACVVSFVVCIMCKFQTEKEREFCFFRRQPQKVSVHMCVCAVAHTIGYKEYIQKIEFLHKFNPIALIVKTNVQNIYLKVLLKVFV